MAAVNLIIMVESIRDLATTSPDEDVKPFHLPAVIAVAIALGLFTGKLADPCKADFVVLRNQVYAVSVLLQHQAIF